MYWILFEPCSIYSKIYFFASYSSMFLLQGLLNSCSIIEKINVLHFSMFIDLEGKAGTHTDHIRRLEFFDDIRNTCNCNPWTLSLMTLLSTFLTKLISPLVKFSKTGFDPIVNLENLLKWIRKISSRNKVEIILWI